MTRLFVFVSSVGMSSPLGRLALLAARPPYVKTVDFAEFEQSVLSFRAGTATGNKNSFQFLPSLRSKVMFDGVSTM